MVVLTCFVMCGCVYVWVLYSVRVSVICVLVFTVYFIISFMYIYSYLFCLYESKDYCHRVTTQLKEVIIIIMLCKRKRKRS